MTAFSESKNILFIQINSTNPYDKAYVNNSKALENIIRSLETNETTKEKASCQNMLVWVSKFVHLIYNTFAANKNLITKGDWQAKHSMD